MELAKNTFPKEFTATQENSQKSDDLTLSNSDFIRKN